MTSLRVIRLGIATFLLLAGCDRLTATRTPTELVFAPAASTGEAATPVLLEAIRSGLAAKLERERRKGTVAVDGEQLRVVLAPGVPQKALQGLRDELGRSVRLGFHEVDDAAMRAVAAELPAGARLVERDPAVAIEVEDRRAAEDLARALAPRVGATRTTAVLSPATKDLPWEVLVLAPAALDQRSVKDASVIAESSGPRSGEPLVALEMTREGAATLSELSTRLIGHRIAIVVNGRVHMAPTVQSRIAERVQITLGAGGSPQEKLREASGLVLSLTRGSPIPVPLRLVSERQLP